VRQANVPALRLLLQSKAEPNARCLCLERGCEFPLQVVASGAKFLSMPDRCQAAALLLRAGARPNPRRTDAEANTPLHDCVRRGDLDMTHLLLRYSADPHSPNGYGETPLCLAVRLVPGVVDFMPGITPVAIVEALLKAGASPLVIDGRGLPLDVGVVDPQMRQLLKRWSGWWRCRMLAWIRSRTHRSSSLWRKFIA